MVKFVKHTICCICLIILCLSVLPIQGRAIGGLLSDNISWNFQDGILTISGQGIVSLSGSKPWLDVRDSITQVVIENGITRIYDNLFGGCKNLVCVSLPATLEFIADGTFHNCQKIKQVHIQDLDAWTRIEFQSPDSNPLCYNGDLYLNGELVTQCTFPAGYTNVRTFTFYGCRSLTSVTIPEGYTIIDGYTFQNCTQLADVRIPASMKKIQWSVFSGCSNLEDVRYGGSRSDEKGLAIYWGNEPLESATWHFSALRALSQWGYILLVLCGVSVVSWIALVIYIKKGKFGSFPR